MKRCAFLELNALLRAGGTGGHQLWPQVSPRAGVSLAIWHNLTARAFNQARLFNPLSSRGLYMCSRRSKSFSRALGKGAIVGLCRQNVSELSWA